MPIYGRLYQRVSGILVRFCTFMMLIGYARVSTQDQTLRLQDDALTAGGCEKLFREKLSGTRTTLPAREKLLAFARKGDVTMRGCFFSIHR